MALEPKTLSELNAIFGTEARAHENDSRFLLGETLYDLRLAFVPGVKAVQVDDMLIPDMDIANQVLIDALRDAAAPYNHETRSHHLTKASWHVDGALYAPKAAIDFSNCNRDILVLARLKGAGTNIAIGEIPKADDIEAAYGRKRMDFRSLFKLAIDLKCLTSFELPLLSCVAFSGELRIGGNGFDRWLNIARYGLVHTIPTRELTAAEEDRLTLLNQYRKVDRSQSYLYAPT